MTIYTLKHSIENCSQTAADEVMVTTDSLYRMLPVSYPMVPPLISYNLPFSHNTARLAYHSVL